MKKSTKKNYLYNLIYQIITIIVPVFTIPYLSRTLGPKAIGTYSYTISIVTYFILFGSLGISLYGQREIAYVQNNIEKRSKVFWELFFLKTFTIFLSSIIYIFIFARTGEYAIYYRLLLLELFASCLDISWFYQGMEEFKKLTIRNVFVRILSVILIFILIKNPNDLVKYLIIYILTTTISNIFLWFDLKKYIKKPIFNIKNIIKRFKFVLYLFIPQVAIQIYTILDKTMIGAILNDMSEVAYYEQSQKIIKILMTIITSVTVVMLPKIANFYATGKNKKIKESMYRTFNFICFLAFPMIFGLIAISHNFVPVFFGEGYNKVKLILSIMSLIILFIGFSGVIGNQYLLTTNKQKKFTISVVVGALINFILNLLLIKEYKSIGATIATVFAEFMVMFIQLFYIRKEFEIKRIISNSKNYLFASILMFIFCNFVKNLFISNLYCLILQVLVGVLSYLLILFLLKDNLILYIFDFITSKIKILYKLYNYILKIFSNILCKILLFILLLIAFTINIIIPIYRYNVWKNSSSIGWEKISIFPVLGNEETRSLFDPYVIVDNDGLYRMYVSYREKKSIAVSISKDGKKWSDLKIVLNNNDDSGWEDLVNRASILYYDEKYYMWYTGQSNGISKIGLAISDDGYNFERISDEPILIPEEKHESYSVMNPNVIYDEEENLFKMYYASGETYEPDVICYATSNDGIKWEKYKKNPIVTKSKGNYLDNYKVGATDVHKLSKNKYLMFYIGYSDLHTARIFYALSEDGINWNKKNIPIISPSLYYFDGEAVYKPSAFFDKNNNRWILWYNGRKNKDEYIGMAICNKCKY